MINGLLTVAPSAPPSTAKGQAATPRTAARVPGRRGSSDHLPNTHLFEATDVQQYLERVAVFLIGVACTLLWAVVGVCWRWLRGSPPKLTPIVGVLADNGLYTASATQDPPDWMPSVAGQAPSRFVIPGRYVVGVEVTNVRRRALHLDQWALRAEPSGADIVVAAEQAVGPTPPCDIRPRGTATFLTSLQNARALASAGSVDSRPQRIRATVSSGDRVYKSKPVAPTVLSIGA
jgi:hypothetical protein